jgi:hypothetical protein
MAHEPTRREVDEKPTPPAEEGGGQRSSNECGSHTHHEKSPGKRPHQGGG